uniref:ATP synthase F0 subunit 8 n=1 Tax=Tetragnatha nitens TaxID=545214 RepID=A0A0N6WE32_9ARAC|nr:ATP synthase F0 subunit 8 [Tetragnatha nitens]AKG65083.1 ATP synthase F0 subunit 8 [Tetragnatha nitens]
MPLLWILYPLIFSFLLLMMKVVYSEYLNSKIIVKEGAGGVQIMVWSW